MKKTFITLICVAAATAVWAEVVQTVNFNPARLGQYERLKVSEKATFKGGLKAQSMQVKSQGTVTITQSETSKLAYDIPLLDARQGFSSSTHNSFPSTPTLDFPKACFSSLEDCVSSSATGNLNVLFKNGAIRISAPSSYTTPVSRIEQITSEARKLRLESMYVTINGKLNVTGVGTASFRNNEVPTNPLRLAGNWIPLPSTSGITPGHKLFWETRSTVKHPDKGGETYKVLALEGDGSTVPTPEGGGCGFVKVCLASAPCPNGQSGTISYVWSDTACACVEKSNTCTTDLYAWQLTYQAPIVTTNLCPVTCLVSGTADGTSINPSSIVPACNASTEGQECKMGIRTTMLTGQTGYRCVRYTCKKV